MTGTENNPVRYVCDHCDTLEEHYGSKYFKGNVLTDDPFNDSTLNSERANSSLTTLEQKAVA